MGTHLMFLECACWGAKFYTPHPPPRKTPFKGWGVHKGGGGIKFLLPRGFQIYTPPPPPKICLMAKEDGRGRESQYLALDRFAAYILAKRFKFSPALYHPNGNKHILNSRGCFDVCVFVLNLNALAKIITHVCVFASAT